RRERRTSRDARPYRPRELRDARIAPSKALGQHFLTDYAFVNRIVAGADLGAQDVVVEVGPGLGILTERLLAIAGHVIAVELDTEMAQRLRETARANLTVVEANALEVEPVQLLEAAG